MVGQRKTTLFATAAIGAVIATGWWQPAIGQTRATASASDGDVTEIGELVVTARRREERLRDIPVAATVVDADQLKARGDIVDPQDILNNISGVKFNDTSSPSQSEVTMRGSGASKGTGSEASVGLYRNDVYIGGGTLGGRTFGRIDLLDVGHVDVLKGPQGALYGRNSTGGAINIISAQPSWSDTGFVDLNYQFHTELKQVQMVVNHPLNDFVAVRFSGEWFDQPKGYFFNADNNTYIDRTKGYEIRGQVRLKRDRLDANLLLEDGWYLLPPLHASFSAPPGSPGFPKGFVTDPHVSHVNSSGPAEQRHTTAIAAVNYSFDFGTLTSTTAYRHRKSAFQNDQDGFDAPFLNLQHSLGNATTINDPNQAAVNIESWREYYEDIHFAGNKIGRFNWLAGFEYLDQKSDLISLRGRTPTKANPSIGTIAFQPSTYKSWAVYGSVGYDLSSRLNLEAEGRYTHDEKSIDSTSFDRLTGAPITTTRTASGSDSWTNFSYTVSLSYHVTPEWLGYARVGSSYRAGGFNINLSDPRAPRPAPPTFNPELATSYEIGAKGNLRSNIYTTLAIYETHVSDAQVQQLDGCEPSNPVCPVIANQYLINGGDGRLWGIEVEATGRFDVFGGDLTANVSGSRQGGTIKSGALAGHAFAQNPKWIGAVNLDYRRQLGSLGQGFVNLNYTTQSGGYQDTSTIPLWNRDLVDARVGLRRAHVEVAAYVKNLTNNDYVVSATATTLKYSEPRIYGLTLRYGW